MRGEMTVTFTLTDADAGTDLLGVHDNLPPGVSPADNETGWQMALDKLAALVEAGQKTQDLGTYRVTHVKGTDKRIKLYCGGKRNVSHRSFSLSSFL
jgi:hypothetical protein